MVRDTPQKGCWTCKDRKISCDGGLPGCLKCLKSKRRCGGYGIRLSWPRETDRKRHVVGTSFHPHRHGANARGALRWINAYSKDIDLHQLACALRKQTLSNDDLSEYVQFPNLQCRPARPHIGHGSDNGLLQYFETVVINLVSMFESNRTKVRRLLMQMALSDDSPSSKAVMHSMLALASLYRDGNQSHAAELKSSAIYALMLSSGKDISAGSALQHVAAAMLLCAYELRNVSQRSPLWLGHICGAKEIIKSVLGTDHAEGSDTSVMLGWFYHYDILARFSIRHWRIPMLEPSSLAFKPDGAGCALQYFIARSSFAMKISGLSNHGHPILRLLSEVLDTILYPWGPQYHSDDYRRHVGELESRLANYVVSFSPNPGAPTESEQQGSSYTPELFPLAGLMYLERAAMNVSGPSAKLDQYTREAFAILSELEMYPHSFPLFVFGCEARTDEQRMAILDLITKTEQKLHGRNMDEIREMIEAVWTQQDLETEGEVEYIRILNLVISHRDPIPSFI